MTKTLNKVGLVVAGAILAVASYGMMATSQVDAKGRPGNGQTIAAIASSNPNFSILVGALVCTDLVDLVSGNRQLTVFAPLNSAFTAVDPTINEANVCEKLGTENLANILAYHVTPGIKDSTNVLSRNSMNMLNRDRAQIAGATIDGANIVGVDNRATNGMVHVIDAVMLP